MLPVDARTVGLRTVFKDKDTVSPGELHETGHIGRTSVEMNDDDRSRTISDQTLDSRRRDELGIEIDVCEHRLGANNVDARRRRDEASGRHNDFVAGSDIIGSKNCLERERSVGQGERVGTATQVSKGALKGLYLLAGPLID